MFIMRISTWSTSSWKPSWPPPFSMTEEPTLDVMISSVFLKSTVRPCSLATGLQRQVLPLRHWHERRVTRCTHLMQPVEARTAVKSSATVRMAVW